MAIILDASVTLLWCFPDEQSSLSLKVLDRLKAGEEIMVPAFWSVEVLNSLLKSGANEFQLTKAERFSIT